MDTDKLGYVCAWLENDSVLFDPNQRSRKLWFNFYSLINYGNEDNGGKGEPSSGWRLVILGPRVEATCFEFFY